MSTLRRSCTRTYTGCSRRITKRARWTARRKFSAAQEPGRAAFSTGSIAPGYVRKRTAVIANILLAGVAWKWDFREREQPAIFFYSFRSDASGQVERVASRRIYFAGVTTTDAIKNRKKKKKNASRERYTYDDAGWELR